MNKPVAMILILTTIISVCEGKNNQEPITTETSVKHAITTPVADPK